MIEPTQTPVLLIHFNRPEATRRQLAALQEIRPARLWLLCDGPRQDRPGEVSRVAEVRRLLSDLPWPCQVERRFRDENLGCFRNIAEGLDWFLGQCGAGIILEDDCLPDPSFFRFCHELLDRYADRDEVMAISGHTGRDRRLGLDASYAFSNYFGCWGWATWKRAWDRFDPELRAWRDGDTWRSITERVLSSFRARLYWNWIMSRVANGRRDSWAYRFQLSVWKEQGLVAIPDVNLVRNVGDGPGATHAGQVSRSAIGTESLAFPLEHPATVAGEPALDRWFEDQVHSKSLPVRCAWGVRKVKQNLNRLGGTAAC